MHRGRHFPGSLVRWARAHTHAHNSRTDGAETLRLGIVRLMSRLTKHPVDGLDTAGKGSVSRIKCDISNVPNSDPGPAMFA